jgi:hypothetical protein
VVVGCMLAVGAGVICVGAGFAGLAVGVLV